MTFGKWDNKYVVHSRNMNNEYNLKMVAFEIWSVTMTHRKYQLGRGAKNQAGKNQRKGAKQSVGMVMVFENAGYNAFGEKT